MNKKIVFILVLLINMLFVTKAYCANKHAVKKNVSKNFVNSFYNCSAYTKVSDTSIVQVLGWANRKCYFREINSQRTVDCAFSRTQFNRIRNLIKTSKNRPIKDIYDIVNVENLDIAGACRFSDAQETEDTSLQIPGSGR